MRPRSERIPNATAGRAPHVGEVRRHKNHHSLSFDVFYLVVNMLFASSRTESTSELRLGYQETSCSSKIHGTSRPNTRNKFQHPRHEDP